MALPTNDDDSYGLITLGMNINFFGRLYSNFSINTNGLISFRTNETIFPFNTDIDTNKGGKIYFRESSISSDLVLAQADIFYANYKNFEPKRVFIITWDKVSPYSGSGHNTFQAVIATDQRNTFLIYNYGVLMWPFCSYGTYVGYSTFDSRNSSRNIYQISVKNLTNESNMSPIYPGKWIYRIDE